MPLVQGRELKLQDVNITVRGAIDAPCTGARIET